jgi:hypothetical protein
MYHRRHQGERAQKRPRHVAPHDVPDAQGPSESEATVDGKASTQSGPAGAFEQKVRMST